MKIGDILQILLTTEDEIIFGTGDYLFKRDFNSLRDRPDLIKRYNRGFDIFSDKFDELYRSIGGFIDCAEQYLNFEDDWKMYEIVTKTTKGLQVIK